MKRDPIDFASIPVSQWEMDNRLINWARWQRGASGERARTVDASPMFALYRSSDARREYGAETVVSVDKDDALKIHFAIVHPEFDPQLRRALQWNYLDGRHPAGAARQLGVTMLRLSEMVKEGRLLLISRKA